LVVQSIHRLLAVIFASNVRLQKYQLRLFLCIIQWLVSILFSAYFIYIQPQLKYDPVSYVCVTSDNASSILIICLTMISAFVPFTIIAGSYIRLFIYVRRLRRPGNLSLTSKRELRMAKRIFFLLAILGLGSIPGIIFSSIKPPPDYQYRIYYLSVTTTSFCCLICMFPFTPQVKQWLIQQKNKMNTRAHRRIYSAVILIRN
jgi:hypothetical protein